jgi:hypothetical protein
MDGEHPVCQPVFNGLFKKSFHADAECRIGDRPVYHPPFDLAAGNEYRRTRSFESPSRIVRNQIRRMGRDLLGSFIWQGAPTEVLTCNALEWQESQGGGAIIDDGRTGNFGGNDRHHSVPR